MHRPAIGESAERIGRDLSERTLPIASNPSRRSADDVVAAITLNSYTPCRAAYRHGRRREAMTGSDQGAAKACSPAG